jgi:hypothetical protein
MTLLTLIKKGGLYHVATAIPATTATGKERKTRTVARIATVAVASPQNMAGDRSAQATDPLLSVEQWYPEFHRFHMAVIAETPDFDYGWLRRNRLVLYQEIKAAENEIDALGSARLSNVIALMRQWRELILMAEFERRQSTR